MVTKDCRKSGGSHIFKEDARKPDLDPSGKSRPSLDSLVEIANALGISADDLLVDSLEHSVSTADSDLHRLLLECNEMEETILTRTVKELKTILYSLGI